MIKYFAIMSVSFFSISSIVSMEQQNRQPLSAAGEQRVADKETLYGFETEENRAIQELKQLQQSVHNLKVDAKMRNVPFVGLVTHAQALQSAHLTSMPDPQKLKLKRAYNDNSDAIKLLYEQILENLEEEVKSLQGPLPGQHLDAAAMTDLLQRRATLVARINSLGKDLPNDPKLNQRFTEIFLAMQGYFQV